MTHVGGLGIKIFGEVEYWLDGLGAVQGGFRRPLFWYSFHPALLHMGTQLFQMRRPHGPVPWQPVGIACSPHCMHPVLKSYARHVAQLSVLTQRKSKVKTVATLNLGDTQNLIQRSLALNTARCRRYRTLWNRLRPHPSEGHSRSNFSMPCLLATIQISDRTLPTCYRRPQGVTPPAFGPLSPIYVSQPWLQS